MKVLTWLSARHLIEHLPDPNSFMAEVARILRPGGYFYVRTPSSKALGRKLFGKYWYPNDVPRHLVLFSPRKSFRPGSAAWLEKGQGGDDFQSEGSAQQH